MKAINVAVAGSLLAACGAAGAADFAMMETAERINQGSFKASGFPVVIDRGRADAGNGLALGLGYGLPYGMDVEAHVARYYDGTFTGADLEWTAWRNDRMTFSVGSGLHGADLDGGGYAAGGDGTAIFSYVPMHRLTVSAALNAAIDDVNDRDANAPADSRFPTDGIYERYHAVQGVGYTVTRNIDLMAEFGVGLNGESDNYASAGMSWYFR